MDTNAMRPDSAKVVYLPGAAPARAAAARSRAARAARAAGAAGALGVAAVARLAWGLARVIVCAFLVLIEPLMRLVFCAGAFLLFVATLVFGFLIGHPSFPKWSLLGASAGMMIVYWLYLGLMSLFMRLPPVPYDERY